MEKIIGFVKKEKILLLILLVSFILRIIFLSSWLEDWDSVQFALGLHDFSIVKHQPHPPGYPLYMLLGRVFNLFLQNDTLALTSLSAILGAATAIPFFLLAREIMGKRIALFSTALFLVVPVHWTLSEVALSNVPGMFFAVLSVLFIYKGKALRKYLLLGSFLAGLALGIRFAEYSILLALLALVLVYRKKWSDFVKAGIYFSFGFLLWLVPLIADTGWGEFIASYKTQVSYIAAHDSFLAYSAFSQRLFRIWELFLMGYSIYFVPFILLILWYIIKNYKALRQYNNLFLLIWFFSYLIPLAFIYNLEVPRHLLPLLPPLVLLSGLILKQAPKASIIYAIAGLLVFLEGLTQVQKLHTLTPPTIAPVLYVKENFNPEETVLITSFTYRQFQYYAPEFKNYYFGRESPVLLDTAEKIIIDLEKIKEEVRALENFGIVTTKEFFGPEIIFPRLPKTKLYLLEKTT